MDIEPNPFWTLLSQSQILPVDVVETLTLRFGSDRDGEENEAHEIADSLVDERIITRFHADVLTAGRHGPFRFGEYLVLEQFDSGPLAGCYSAKHDRAGHRVLIEFAGADDEEGLKRWREIKSKANQVKQVQSNNLIAVHETVALPEYRMIVSQRINGVSLGEKVPRKGRLPWENSCGIAAQIANALGDLHKADIAHGHVSPKNIWLTNKGPAMLRVPFQTECEFNLPESEDVDSRNEYLAPELDANAEPTEAGDLYALGCTLHRILRGLPPFYESSAEEKKEAHRSGTPGSLEKYELPDELTSLLDQLLSKDPKDRPNSIETVVQELAKLSGKPDEVLSLTATPRETEAAYLLTLKSAGPDLGKPFVPETVAPEITRDEEAKSEPPREQWQEKNRKRKNSMPLIVGLSLAGLTALVVGAAFLMDQTKIDSPVVKREETNKKIEESPQETLKPSEYQPSNPLNNDPNLKYEAGERFAQQLIDDDGDELWETPTIGPLANFRYLPPAVQIVFSLRPQSMLQQPEGKRVLRALDSSLATSTEWLQTAAGLELNEMDHLMVAYCSTGQLEYSTCYVVRTEQPIAIDRLVELWKPSVDARDPKTGIFENSQGFGYYVIPNPDDPQQAVGFAMGPAPLMRSISEVAGANTLSGTLGKLSKLVDGDRHFNCLAVIPSLYNDEGQSLLRGPLAPTALYLRNTLPESVRGVMLSMHLDNGCYLEATVDHGLQTTPIEMGDELRSWIQSLRETVTTNVTSSGSNPYWDKLRARFGIQLNELYRNLRVGVEGKDVFVNCWLPEVAAHNLVAGSELAITFAGGSSGAPPTTTTYAGPPTIEKLLETPRDLSVTTTPDLGLLLESIKSEIMDDYGNLPFKFDIKLMGNDLRADGITQNQRPGDFEISQKPLGDILAEIMYKANPEKEATGPSDPLCKLIWVLAEEPAGSGQPIILITTRAAAADKGYQIPKQFDASQ